MLTLIWKLIIKSCCAVNCYYYDAKDTMKNRSEMSAFHNCLLGMRACCVGCVMVASCQIYTTSFGQFVLSKILTLQHTLEVDETDFLFHNFITNKIKHYSIYCVQGR